MGQKSRQPTGRQALVPVSRGMSYSKTECGMTPGMRTHATLGGTCNVARCCSTPLSPVRSPCGGGDAAQWLQRRAARRPQEGGRGLQRLGVRGACATRRFAAAHVCRYATATIKYFATQVNFECVNDTGRDTVHHPDTGRGGPAAVRGSWGVGEVIVQRSRDACATFGYFENASR